MKLLEEDEDESNYSGAEVEAFTAALNRDIGGNASVSQIANSDVGVFSDRINFTSNKLLEQQIPNQEENLTGQRQQKEEHDSEEKSSSQIGAVQSESVAWNPNQHDQLLLEQKQFNENHQHQQTQQSAVQFPEKGQVQTSEQNPVQHAEQGMFQRPESQHQYSKLPQLNRHAQATDQTNNPMRHNKPIPNISFSSLIPVLRPHLDKDRAMQLHTIFTKLRNNEVSKENFLRVVRNIVGDQMLRMAAHKVQMQYQQQAQVEAAQNSQTSTHQYQLQPHASVQQHMVSACGTQKLTESPSFSQSHPMSSTQHQKENSAQKSQQAEIQSNAQGLHVNHQSYTNIKTSSQERELSLVSQQSFNNQQHQTHLPSTSFSLYGSQVGSHNVHAYSGSSVSGTSTNMKTKNQEIRIRQVSHLQGMVSTQIGTGQAMNPMSETQRGSLSHLTSHSTLQQNAVAWQSPLNKSGLSSMDYVKQEPVDKMANQQHKPQLLPAQSIASFGSGCTIQGFPAPDTLKDEATEKQSARIDLLTSESTAGANAVSGSAEAQLDSSMQMQLQMPSTTTTAGTGTTRTPPKKPSVGQKKPLEAHVTSSPLSSKKQKVSGALQDQSIEQLNDVTAVSGVNLRDEEEQLLAAPKEESRASEASRRVVQEEEERLILQKGPLQKKIAEIMSKCGVMNTSNDVERCLSLSVEERLRGLINNLIRLSKQRVDIERARHRICITSDVRRQILIMNRKAKEHWEKKQAEEDEKLRKQNEGEGNGVDVDKEKDENCLKATKVNKEEDDKMRTKAANVAARAAVGGDDVQSKWQLMAEKARLKREGGQDGASGAQPGKDPIQRHSSATGRMSESQEEENNSTSVVATASGFVRKLAKNPALMPQRKIARNITVKDVIAALEREPQMSKSALIYRLYERTHTDSMKE